MSYLIEKKPQPPRKLLNILEQFNITVLADSSGTYLQDKFGVSFKKGGRNFIVCKSDLPSDVLSLTLMHELAHFILGHLLEETAFSSEQKEFEAESLGFILYSYLNNPFYSRKAGIVQ